MLPRRVAIPAAREVPTMRILRRFTHYSVRFAAITAFVFACSAHAADPNKILRLAQGDIATLDPHQWIDYFSGWVGAAIFEGLYEWDYLARPVRLAPNTAEALPQISDDGRTWTMRVKPGIYFTDDPAFNGKPRELTAQDFVYSFKRRLDPNLPPGGQGALMDALVSARAAFDAAHKPGEKFDYDAALEGVRALDRYTIQFRLVQPNYPVMEQYLTDTYAVAREVVDAAGRDIDTRPVGTGPYRLKAWKRGASIVLEANPNYRELRFPESSNPADAALVREMHGKRLPQIGVVRISIIEEMQSRLLDFERGGLDYVEIAGESANRLLQKGKLKPEYGAAGIRHYILPSSY